MKIYKKQSRGIIYTIIFLFCCIYYLTYKFWDVRTIWFKYVILALIIFGLFSYFIRLVNSKKTLFGQNKFFYMFLILQAVFLLYAIGAASSSQRSLALYQYSFYSLILLSCLFYLNKANVNVVFNVLRIVGCLLAVLSVYENITRAYLVPVDEWYGKVNYSGVWFLRAKVFTGSPMVYGLEMAILSLVAFDFYHKKRGVVDLLIFIVNLVGLFTSLSRGPYVAFVIALIVYMLFDEKTNKKKVIKYAISGIVLFLFVFLVIEVGSRSNVTLALVKARVFSIFQWSDKSNWTSNSSRLSIWESTLHIIFDGHNWITGIGAAATGARTISTGGFVTESGVLRRIVEFGFPIAILYYYFLLGIIRTGYRKSKRNYNIFTVLELSVIVCILIEDIVLQITEEISVTFFLWAFISAMLTCKDNKTPIVKSP